MIPLRRLAAESTAPAGASPEALSAASRLDPLNDAYLIRLAQTRQDRGEDPLPAFRRAIALNPRRDLSLTQAAIAAEWAGQRREAELLLLQAARYNQVWLPRWSLANFYHRHADFPQALRWAALALERSYGDRTAVFRLCLDAGATPERMLREIVPADPDNLAAYTEFLASRPELAADGLEPAALRLLTATRESSSARVSVRGTVVRGVNTLIRLDQPLKALRLWDGLVQAGVISGGGRSAAAPLYNAGFSSPVPEGGFDWIMPAAPGVDLYPGVPAGGIKLQFSGTQPESAALIQQTVLLRGGTAWTLSYEYQTPGISRANSGLSWTLAPAGGGAPIVPSSNGPLAAEDWTAGATTWALPPGGVLFRLALEHRRNPGQTRLEGELRIRNLTLREARP